MAGVRLAASVDEETAPPVADLRWEVQGTYQPANQDEPRRPLPEAEHFAAATEEGYKMEFRWHVLAVEIERITVWVDENGDGQANPGELIATSGPAHLSGGGCDGITDLDRIVLARSR